MPTYDYKCTACGHQFEKFQSITAAPVRKCPRCGKAKVRRLIGMGAGVIFKGSGFHQTDYRSESYRKAAEKDMPPSCDAKNCPADPSKCPKARKDESE
ncbi:MAG TPA: zinc ribbon domain-containing protein [Phycisphaerae bacterium]|nr:zinc ribbon domain-containing protein [Phycisphaerae bacterium]HUT60139.1 zinc ribbon domain-containing protein [Phycisphaerae bacterium]